MCGKVDNHLSSRCDAGTKSKRWSCLLKKVATEKLKTIIRNIRTQKLKATKGNHLATGQTFKEIAKNNDVLKDYYKNSKPFWVRAGKATGSEVGVVPDFGAIETNLTNATKVGEFVSGHTAAGIKEKFNNRKTKAKKQKTKHQRVEKPPANIFCNKLWKVFVDESGAVIRGGKPVSTYNNFQPPITNGMTFYLCRFDEQGNNHE